MKKVLGVMLWALGACSMSIQFAEAQSYRNQFGITSDNDLYTSYKNDRYYTDGTIFNFTHAMGFSKATSPNLVTKTLELELGQKIYNPYSPNVPDPYKQDRPFTGYLYGGASLNWLFVSESAIKLTAQIGTIGPAAMGRQVQTAFHKLLGIQKVDGWQYQLNNAPGLDFAFDYKKRLYRNANEWFDLGINPSVWVGNTFTGASFGPIIRVGQLDNFFHSALTNSRVSNEIDGGKNEFYLLIEPEFQYIGWDATIEGGYFRKDKGFVTYGIYHTVFVQKVGVQFASKRWTASYMAYFKTQEVKSSAVPDQYGSINLSYRFGRN